METNHPEGMPPSAPSSKATEGSLDIPKGKEADMTQPRKGDKPTLRVEKTAFHHRDVSAGASPPRPMKQTSKKHLRSQSNPIQAWRDIFSGHKSRSSKDSRRVPHKTKRLDGPPRSSTTVRSQNIEPGEPPTSTEHVVSSKLGVCFCVSSFFWLLLVPDPNFLCLCLPQKAELGRHVNEKQMPDWLVALLEKDGAVCSEGTFTTPTSKRPRAFRQAPDRC